ncbi:Uncharacterised protein [Klebsiella michiganensis]|uniref:Uncharacterized protein n=1 Tax=Klebsiella michiganensis TaxID=1134687 RepID=A0A7H4LSU5_9ENTR|nr:Uncharacterised protein [Klebsiella michiganensis]
MQPRPPRFRHYSTMIMTIAYEDALRRAGLPTLLLSHEFAQQKAGLWRLT